MGTNTMDAEVLITAFHTASGDEAMEIIFISLLTTVVALNCA
jgi:hypothetical protein